MKLRFKLSLVPFAVERATVNMPGASVVGPAIEFDLTVIEPHTREGMVEYMARYGAEFVAEDPQGQPGVV
jgi:hypothetical protein